MKVLLDTNIIILRETANIVPDNIGGLFKWIDKLHYEKYIHSLTKIELGKHQDSRVVSNSMAKLTSYNELIQAPIHPLIEQCMEQFDTSENDKNDSLLLNEVVQERVDALISEDKKIHRKAAFLNVSEKVFTIENFLYKVNVENPSLIDYKVLSVKQRYIGELDINDPFWDGFKRDYKGFEKWFNKKAQEDCYVSQDDDGKILAFLYLKIEDAGEQYENISPKFQPKKRLKIGTFKVANNGFKLGERFIRIVFENALKQNAEEIYLTIFRNEPQHEFLIDLIEQWGFQCHGIKSSESGKEEVYVRDFPKRFDEANIKHTYPFISKNKKIYFVSIYPEYHTDLLPDSILSNENAENFVTDKAYRNAIHKVFISRSIERDLKTGDIILFYRTKALGQSAYYTSVITTIGVVESIKTDIKDVETFISLCRKRSVFTDNELKKHWDYNPRRRPFIVNFLYVYSFPKPYINLKRLIELKVILSSKDAPRGFEEISTEKFNLLLEEPNVKHDFIVD